MSVKVAIFNGIDATTGAVSGVTQIATDIHPYGGATVAPGDTIAALIDLATLAFPSPDPGFLIISPNRLSQPLFTNLSANRYLAIFTSP